MHLSEYAYTIPSELVAQQPQDSRSASRLLCLDQYSGQLQHRRFADLSRLLVPGDLLIFNDTRVLPARLYGQKSTGGKLELLIEKIIDYESALAHIKSNHPLKIGAHFIIESAIPAELVARERDLFKIKFTSKQSVYELLMSYGHVPLPTYIKREDTEEDRQRYQTVYAKHDGAVAAPTAGLHFDERLLQQLQEHGVEFAYVTLHVGAGTFQPVRAQQIEQHQMHSEVCMISSDVCDKIGQAKQRGNKVIAVGTTTVRCLETAAKSGSLQPFSGETDLFIYPGYRFKVNDGLITNFHLPESSLLMLVSAFAGHAAVMQAYEVAIAEKYRFFSYGDAMLIMDFSCATK